MLLIPCPYCGPRSEIEFRCGGEAHIARPAEPARIDDVDWASFLFYRTNPKGVHFERWLHAHGCQRWFNALRDTASDRIVETYAMGAARPAVPSTVVAPPTPNPSPQGGGESARRQSYGVPSPIVPEARLRHDVGEGKGGGESTTSAVVAPPTPNPSPQGGGESARRQSYGVPSPLVGEGQGGGDGRTSAEEIPPTPNPSPQGGGEGR